MEENKFQIVGVIEKKFPIKEISATFKKQEFLLVIEDVDYKGEPNEEFVKFQCVQNMTTRLSEVKEGDKVIVEYKLTGRKWENTEKETTMYFTNLNVLTIDLLDGTGVSTLGNVIKPGEVLAMDGGDLLTAPKNENAVDDELFVKPESQVSDADVIENKDEPEDCNAGADFEDMPF